MTGIKKLEAPVIIDVSVEDEEEEVWDEEDECMLWESAPTNAGGRIKN